MSRGGAVIFRRGSVSCGSMILLLCGFAVNVSFAQEEGQDGPPADEAIEEITVYGEQSLTSLKFEYEVAEEDFYDLFSELNDDPEYDVACRTERREGSHINHRVCRPRYELDVLTQDAQAILGMRGRVRAPVDATVMEKDRILRDKIAQLASEDPRLLEALVNYRDKYQIYESERARRCVGGPVFCGGGDSED